MTHMSSRQSHDTQDEVFGKYGCAVFILAAVLFAVQRLILFSWLLYQSSLGRAFAPSATEFLFGNPPYTFTDILLGLEFPDEGLLYLLQPHNLAIAVTQAAHFGITIGLVYIPFFLFIRARTSPRHRVWLRAGGCLFALAIPVSIAVLTATFVVAPFLHDGVTSPTPPAAPTMTTAPTSAPEPTETIPLLSAAASTPAPPPRATPSGIVVWMEADGSGDYATLEEAVDNAPETAAIVLGPGTYRLDQPLTIDKSLRLYGAGMDVTQVASDAGAYVIRFAGEGPYAVEAISFLHDGETPSDVVVVDNARRGFGIAFCTIGGAVFGDGGELSAGLRLRGETVGRVTACAATANNTIGILVEELAKARIEYSLCTNNSVGIAYVDSSGGVAIATECSHNLFGIEVHGDATPTLEENLVQANEESGIGYFDRSGGVARQNECSDNRLHGIEIQNEAQPELTGNACTNNGQSGIAFWDTSSGTARENECSRNQLHGIGVADQARPTLERNVCEENEQSGIAYLGNAAGVARHNLCSKNGYYGIGLQGEAQPTLEANVCSHNQRCGMMYSENAAGLARENECVSNGVGIAVAESANPQLVDNNCHDNTSRDIWDNRS